MSTVDVVLGEIERLLSVPASQWLARTKEIRLVLLEAQYQLESLQLERRKIEQALVPLVEYIGERARQQSKQQVDEAVAIVKKKIDKHYAKFLPKDDVQLPLPLDTEFRVYNG